MLPLVTLASISSIYFQFSFHLDFIGIMDQAIKDLIGQGATCNKVMAALQGERHHFTMACSGNKSP
jgi:hypothetical protein